MIQAEPYFYYNCYCFGSYGDNFQNGYCGTK